MPNVVPEQRMRFKPRLSSPGPRPHGCPAVMRKPSRPACCLPGASGDPPGPEGGGHHEPPTGPPGLSWELCGGRKDKTCWGCGPSAPAHVTLRPWPRRPNSPGHSVFVSKVGQASVLPPLPPPLPPENMVRDEGNWVPSPICWALQSELLLMKTKGRAGGLRVGQAHRGLGGPGEPWLEGRLQPLAPRHRTGPQHRVTWTLVGKAISWAHPGLGNRISVLTSPWFLAL